MTDRAVVIGVGNPWRGDDGAGLEVARRLAAHAPDGVRIVQRGGGDQLGLLDAWADAERAIVIDAASSGAPAGAVHRFDATAAPLPAPFLASNSHTFGVAEAVELARVLGRLPRSLQIYAIEGESFAAGRGLTPGVQRAVQGVVDELRGVWPAGP